MARNINLLLVCGNPRWGRAVRGAAADIGASLLHVLPSAREAISRLIGRHTTYSHLLLEPACAGEHLDDLVGLTSGQVGSGTEMLLLGDWTERPPEVDIIASADRRSIVRALSPRQKEGCDMSEVAPAELRRALSGSMIKAWYQPIVRIVDGVPVGLEALARLKDPVRGTVAPDRFVPQIEAAGLGPELTDAVAARAFADLASSSLADQKFSLALNLPLDVLLVPEAIERLEVRRRENGLDADRILIELTESRPVGDLPALRAAIERMRKAGYGLAIDDVGPAVPNYAAMIEMPFTALKLDKVIVQQACGNDNVRSFVSNTIEAARIHGLKVIAEGVEDMRTWNLVRELGADEAQGFLISRPLPLAALPLWLKAWRRRSRSS